MTDARAPDTRIFSPFTAARLCVTIGHQLNEFNRLISLRSPSIYRSKHIVPNGSGKAVAKQLESRLLVLPRFRHKTIRAGIVLALQTAFANINIRKNWFGETAQQGQ